MNAYMFHMLERSRDIANGRILDKNGDPVTECPFCKFDELQIARVNFVSRPKAPDCSFCSLRSLYNVKLEDLREDCVTFGKHALDVYTYFFDGEDSVW